MAQLSGGTEGIELFHQNRSSFRSQEEDIDHNNEESGDVGRFASEWATIERLPTFERIRSSLFDSDANAKRVVDVTKLDASEKHLFIEKLIRHIENDNLKLLQKIRKRIDKVGVKLPAVEVRYHDLCVEAECEVVDGKPLPTLWNSFKSSLLDLIRLLGLRAQTSKISIIDGVSGIIKPGRMTLLLGPPGCGKTSFLKALSGNLDDPLKVTGEISYNGFKLSEFVPQKTCIYISQYDLHIPEMTVRETLDFSARCQGIGRREEIMVELSKKERDAGVFPDPDVDTYMKAISVEGKRTTLQTDYILKILGLDICADTIVGDALMRGVSGGEKKRLTTGEMIVGPTQTLFMDEISNGLDSSTTHQIIACLQHLAHIAGATILVSLLQPAPETFDLFDDIILMAKGKIVYHGPRSNVLEFFESCGFRCPDRKGVADFLQEVISEKDQAQYWIEGEESYSYVTVDTLSRKFEESEVGKMLRAQISVPFDKSKECESAINFSSYSLPKWTLFKACISRELLLMKRNCFVYVHKSIQLFIIASMTMTVFLRRRTDLNLVHANYYMGALFFALVILIIDGLPEQSMTVARLPGIYKQRDLYFYPAWAYAIPSAVLKIPISLFEATVWTCITYYGIGYSPEVGRFFSQVILLFALHFTSISMFRFLASVFRTQVATTFAGTLALMLLSLFSGFLIPRTSMPIWLKWGFWVSPMTYGEIGLALNEFLAPRWQKMLPSNLTVGRETLEARGLNFDKNFIWISVGALFGFTILFNIGFTLALTFLNPVGSRAMISREKLSQTISKRSSNISHAEEMSGSSSADRVEKCHKGKIILPFETLTVVFQDLQYYVGAPAGLKEHGFTKQRLQLLRDITGALKPGVLTALMGVSGAGKTTLLDVLAGRKTSGTIEGEIKIGGYPKVQKTFARISGYCEQLDIHSPQITVEESLVFSAWLRLDPQIDAKTKSDFVKEVLETIELDTAKDHLVGMPGVSGLSTEQRKRLTIAVELVANPSIIFLDEPTTGLDARAAAIVMRAVKNVADTGRTTVCTIHQPSIDIFEKFDELILLKPGGRMMYYGPLGENSCKVIEHFESISGVPKIKNNYNPATWMLEVTSISSEAELGVDFADIYRDSALYENNKVLVAEMSKPAPGSKPLDFPTSYSQTSWEQFKACLWKHYWSYWRSPSYNLMRFCYMLLVSLVFGFLYWNQGTKLDDQQSLFSVFGSMYMAVFFCGVNNCASVFPYINTERAVFYRERFAGMYNSWAYAIAQLIIEIPYIFVQAVEFTVITYPMIGYYMSAYKIFWYIYAMFCTLLYFNYLGMMIVAMSPSFFVASNLQSAFLIVFNLFAGYLIPRPQFPKWWTWLYYITPTAWTLNGMLTSQYGDIKLEIEAFGQTKTVADFLRDYFGFHHNQLPIVAFMSILFPITFAYVFAYCIGKLNYQKR